MSLEKTAPLIKVVAGLQQLTGDRDRTLIQQSLMNTLLDVLPCHCCRLYTVLPRSVSIELEIAAMANQATEQSTVDAREDLADLVQTALAAKEVSINSNGEGLLVVLPVFIRDESCAEALILECEKFDDEDMILTNGLLTIYSNFLSLVKEHSQDKLTGLLNRATLDDTLARIIAKQPEYIDRRAGAAEYWVAVIDIDHFKPLNDNYGHLFGDEILLLVAQQIKNSFRDDDKCYRYGGEEFLVILKVASSEHAHKACERLRRSIEERIFPQDIRVTVSIGLVQIDGQRNTSLVIGQADQALYYSKQSGRNKLSCYEHLLAAGIFKQDNVESGSIDLF